MATDFSKGATRGRMLASGKGLTSCLDICYQNKWNDENTILVVSNASDFESRWRIYEKK